MDNPSFIQKEKKQVWLFWSVFLGLIGLYVTMILLEDRFDANFSGTLQVVLSGLAFLILGRFYLSRVNGMIFGLSVFLFLLVTKWDILGTPPYGDSVGGPFVEAIWLYRHHFDYLGLAQQPGYIEGGAKVYLFCIYPTFLAILMKLIPDVQLFLWVNHVIVLIMGASVLTLFRHILLKVTDAKTAFLVTVLLMSLPLFQAQVEILNMEMPLVFFSMWAVFSLVYRRMGLACLFSLLAALTKGVGILICAATFLVSLYLFIFEKGRQRWSHLGWGVLALLFFIGHYLATFYILYEKGIVDMVGTFHGWKSLVHMGPTYLYLLSLIIFIGVFWVTQRRTGERFFPSLRSFLKKHYIALIFFIAAGAWFGLFINSYSLSYRYWLLLYPLNIFCIFYVTQMLNVPKRIFQPALFAVIFISLLGSYGLFFRSFTELSAYNEHVILERSLEYRRDLRFYQHLAKTMEEKYSPFKIGAPFIVAQTLALPELGYVQKPLQVMIYGFPCHYGDIENFMGLKHLDLKKTIWIGFDEKIRKMMEVELDYPIDPQDKIVERVVWADRQATLFLGGIAVEKMRLLNYVALKVLAKEGLLKSY